MNIKYKIALFNTTRAVIKADQICRENGLKPVVIPVPDHLSSECGMCLRINSSENALFDSLMSENQIQVKIYEQGE